MTLFLIIIAILWCFGGAMMFLKTGENGQWHKGNNKQRVLIVLFSGPFIWVSAVVVGIAELYTFILKCLYRSLK
jgi:hypothetical protein